MKKSNPNNSKFQQQLVAWLGLGVILTLMCKVPLISSSSCPPDSLALYQVIMETHWSKINFPKDYPVFSRPPPQWSKLIGRSHDGNFTLFRLGSFATLGFKKWAESGLAVEGLVVESNRKGTSDLFTGPSIWGGVGKSEAQFFADGNHTLVSLASKIIPSPDWFVGLDSLDLCPNGSGEWIQSLTIEANPIDAGSDNGLSFTSPKWPSMPQEAIYQIKPNQKHPAHSFYYPDQITSHPIATFTFKKLKEYSSAQLAGGNGIMGGESSSSSSSASEPEYFENEQLLKKPKNPLHSKRSRARKHKQHTSNNNSLYSKGYGSSGSSVGHGHGHGQDCQVSDWTEWSDCTSKACDVGEMYRTRYVRIHPSGPSRTPCPPLTQKRSCIPDKDCQSYFDW